MNYYNEFVNKLGEPTKGSNLIEYIEFVISNDTSNSEEYTEKHHILPRCLFDDDKIFTLKYKDHVSAHLLLAKAYPIQEFERPLNFMLNDIQKELPEYKGILSESRIRSWKDFKKTEKYESWRSKRSMFCSKEMINGKASTMSKIRHSKEGSSEEISKQFKELWSDPIYKKQLIESMVKERNTPKGKARMRKSAQNSWDSKTKETRNDFKNKMKSINQNEKKRADASTKIKARWADPIWRKKMLDSRAESRRIKNETIKG